MAKYLILDNEKVIIKGNHDDNVTIIIRTDKPDLDYQLSDGDYNILVFVDYAGDINMNERGRIDRANVKMTYFELNDHQFCINSNLDVYLDSSLQVLTIVLANSRKRFDFNLYNKEKGSKDFDSLLPVVHFDIPQGLLGVVYCPCLSYNRYFYHAGEHHLTLNSL